MSDLGTIVADIREDLNRGTDFDARIKRAIETAISYYKTKRLGFNVKRAQAVLTSGHETVVLPTDWIEADFLRLEEDDKRQPIDEVNYDWIEDEQLTGESRARPFKYAIQHRNLRLYPVPDKSYTLILSFQFQLTDVSRSASNGASNAWLTEGEELIRKHAMSDLLVNYIDGDEATQKGLLLRTDCEERILPMLEAQAAREQSSGKIKAWL